MKFKAVVFDLFETLITEWGHEKYTKKAMCADLGIEKADFDVYWEEKEQERYLGGISFEESILYACEKCKKRIDPALLARITEKRIRTKSECFNYVLPEVYQMLRTIREMGLKTGLISNCSSEEVQVFRESEINRFFDAAVLSFEVHMKKPDLCIYEEASKRLDIDMSACLFVGDGGSNELIGARNAGMDAIQAKWYTNRHPEKRGNIEGFQVAEEPLDIIGFLQNR